MSLNPPAKPPPAARRPTWRQAARWARRTFVDALDELCDDPVRPTAPALTALDQAQPPCPRCAATVAPEAQTDTGCPHCRGRRLPWERVARLGGYANPLTSWLLAYKFHDRWDFVEPFAEALAPRIQAADARLLQHHPELRSTELFVDWTPLHWMRRLARGFDQAELLARAVAARLHVVPAGLLHRRRRTRPQSRLSAAARARNVAEAFAIEPVDLAGRRVWLIDDVLTTGSTAARCARLLRNRGAASVNLAVLAVADRHQAGFRRTLPSRPSPATTS